jgi:hypothetical protein
MSGLVRACRLWFGIASVGICSLTHAADWVVVGTDGATPNRNMYFAEMNNVNKRFDTGNTTLEAFMQGASKSKDVSQTLADATYYRVYAVQVLENKNDPDTISYTVEVRCKQRQVRLAQAVAWNRNGTQETNAQNQWFAVPDNWLARVHTIACEQDKVSKAALAAKAQNSMDPLTAIGMVYVGAHALYTELSDVTWKNFWKDGNRAEYTTLKTPDEIEKARKEALAQLSAARESLSQTQTRVQTNLDNQTAEEAFIKTVNNTFKSKPSEQRNILYQMEGWTEEQIVGFWGVPRKVSELAGTRALEYYTERDNRAIVVQQNIVREVGQLSTCTMTLYMKPGGSKPGWRLIDYTVRGQNCRKSTLGDLVR